MNHVSKIAVTAGFVLAGCASTKPIPQELTDARAALAHATGSEGAPLVQAQLHVAQTALEKAEKSFSSEPESSETRDLAYLAGRQAQLAEAQGVAEWATRQSGEGQKAISDAHAALTAKRQDELTKAKEQLKELQVQAREALSHIKSLKDSVKQDARGLIITLSSNVLFRSDRAELMPAARGALDDVARALVGAKSQHVVVEGYTDASGPARRNEELSLHRAEAVKNYLVNKGLPANAVKAVGLGPSKPVADNKTAEGRASNRRVEIVVQAEAEAQ